MTTGTKTCRRCGQPIPPGALGGNCPRCLVLLALSTTADAASPRAPAPGAVGEPFRPARFFGDFEILGELARGGMGVVYRARQVSLNRPVALKMIAAGQLATPAQVQRFRLEAEAAGRLDHPNVVSIYEVGEHQGQHFYTMRLIEGGNLAERSFEFRVSDFASCGGPVNAELKTRNSKLAALLAAIARAVHYAHQRGVLHRDLKPTNILIDARGQPHITDFGLAKLLEDDASLTQTVTLLGTPAYMAPELASGHAAEATTAADVYSLGAILYELLAGRPPFVAENVPALLRKIVEEEPKPPSTMKSEIRNPNPEGNPKSAGGTGTPASQLFRISGFVFPSGFGFRASDLDIICLKCLEKEAARRYASAEALAEDLERWRAGESILTRPSAPVERLWRWCRRQPRLAALWSGLALALLAGVSGVAWQWRRAETNARDAHREAARARTAESNATEQLRHTLVEQARAERRTGEAGQRHRALEAVRGAAALGASVELRNEAIAALALPDLRFVPVWTNPYSVFVTDFTPSLTRFAVASANGRIRLFQTRDTHEENPFPPVDGWAQRFQFSPDERFLAVRYSTESNVVWEVATRMPVLSWGPGQVPGVFTPDSRRVLAAETSGLLRCLSVQDGRELWRRLVNARVWSVIVQPRQKYFATYWEGKPNVEVRDLDSGELVRTLAHPCGVGTFAWSPDGQRLVVGLGDGRIYAWEMDSEAEPESWKGHDDAVVALAFAPAGEWLVSGSWDSSGRLWAWPDRSLAVTAHGYSVYASRFDSDGRRLATIMKGPVLGWFEVATSVGFRHLPVPLGEQTRAWSLDVSPDGKLVAAGYIDGARLTDLASGEPRGFQSITEDCRSVLFTPDGRALLTAGPSGLARWPIERVTGSPSNEVRFGPRESIRDELQFSAAARSDDGRWVMAADRPNQRVAVYEVNNPKNRFALAEHWGVAQVAVSGDGRWMATGSWQGSGVKVWELATRSLARELPVVGAATVAFSPDSRLLVSGSRRYQVWEVGSWRELYHTPDTAELGAPGAFSPDGRILATTRDRRGVQLLEADTGRVLADLETPGAAPIPWLRFTPDGASLLALEITRGIQVWDLRRLRAELAALKLDWDTPPSPAKK